jgi:hypothetical protein
MYFNAILKEKVTMSPTYLQQEKLVKAEVRSLYDDKVSIEIRDSNGNLHQSSTHELKKNTKNNINIDCGKLPRGIFLVRFESTYFGETKKIVID